MAKTLPWGVSHIGDMIAPPGVQAGLPDGRWVRAVPEPYWTFGFERLRAAWWVLTGKAHAVVWPKDGDLERALKDTSSEPTIYRHKKRGSLYRLIGIGKMQAEGWFETTPDGYDVGATVDMRDVVIYQSLDDDTIWVRPKEEFFDGRFEGVTNGQ